jgi:hypothetical protein
MAAPSLDQEFFQYWGKLSPVEKESLFVIARNYVQLKAEDDLDDLRKKLVQEERAAYLRGEGKSLTWQEVKQQAIHKDQRDEPSH